MASNAAIDPIFNLTELTNDARESDWGFYWSSTTVISYPTSVVWAWNRVRNVEAKLNRFDPTPMTIVMGVGDSSHGCLPNEMTSATAGRVENRLHC